MTLLTKIVFLLLLTSYIGIEYPRYAVSLDIQMRDRLYEKAEGYYSRDEYEKAEAELEKVIDADPGYAPAYNKLGLIRYNDASTLGESIRYFLKAAKLDPLYSDAFANLGVSAYKLRDYERAKLYLERAISLSPDNPEYYFSLGWVYIEGIKGYRKAIEYIRKAAALRKRDAAAYYLLGLAYIELGQRPEVLEQITNLRMLKKEGLAAALEERLRRRYGEAGGGQREAEEGGEEIDLQYTAQGIDGRAQGPSSTSIGSVTGTGVIELRIKVAGQQNVGFKVKGSPTVKVTGKGRAEVRQ